VNREELFFLFTIYDLRFTTYIHLRVSGDFDIAAVLRDHNVAEAHGIADAGRARAGDGGARVAPADDERRDEETNLIHKARIEEYPGDARAAFDEHALQRATV
jgi:hypothetical protein